MSYERDDDNERLIAIIAEQLGVSKEKVADRMPNLDGIAKDSLDLAEIALLLQDDFGDDGTLS